ncbi:N-myc-interactor-like [Megalops cyprinoides]|uniref:N-myc-interactor-like n=1 Tax=Megalops cyprinoides TaxID=118141 RepID=UPI001864E2E9|nr:N-myc-interactor-like [Megalops cyprinoides]
MASLEDFDIGLLSPEEQKQFTEAREELEKWKRKVENAETEKSRLILDKLEMEETKKQAQKETMDLLAQQQKNAEAASRMRRGLEDDILELEKCNQTLKEKLKEYEGMLKNKQAERDALQQKFKIHADIPEKKVIFTEALKEGEEEDCKDIVSVFTIIQRPSFNLKGGHALITFEEEKVAEKILKLTKCSVICDNTKMDVKPYCLALDPSVKFEVHMNVSKRKIRFSNTTPYLPEERMRDRLEISFSKPSQGGGEVEKVAYNKDTGAGEITFLNTGVAERLTLRKKYCIDASREADVNIFPYFEYQLRKFQTFCGASRRSVLLGGIQDTGEEEDMQDQLEIHFQKPSNHGGEVESIRYLSKGRSAVAYFSEDAAEAEA